MHKCINLAIVMASCFGILLAKPMEALSRYNVILIHGAAPENAGFRDECKKGSVADAYTIVSNNVSDPRSNSWNLGDATGMLGSYDRRVIRDSSDDYNEKSMKKLTYWLDSAVFEDYQYRNGKVYLDSVNLRSSPYIYIQRSFTNPAESPAHNAHEIGDRTWKGEGKCDVRRALVEEAQEVHAEGANQLRKLRLDSMNGYRSIPSRNILIAHSMGGVAS
ncbi:MAG: hypothetical protein HUK20_09625, partial [Fibrobacter sp.]|nr:hypothetical protein [Fibrobacter sp.]